MTLLKICSELSYLIGVYLSDGSVSDRKEYGAFSLASIDKEFVERVLRALEVVCERSYESKIRCERGKVRRWKDRTISICRDQYRILFSNREIVKFLKEEDFDDAVDRYPREFARGLFDGDGTFAWGFSRGKLYSRMYIGLEDRPVLERASEILDDLKIRNSITARLDGKFFSLHVHSGYIARFMSEIGVTIERKRMRIFEYLAVREKRIRESKIAFSNSMR